MSLATVGALATGEYPEAVFVMLFYQVGELFQSYAVDQSRKSITSLMDIRPDYANVERGRPAWPGGPRGGGGGRYHRDQARRAASPWTAWCWRAPPSLDTAALTGESLPREVQPGDDVISGCINLSGLLQSPGHQGVWGVHCG
ncbi:MAG: hypothetical protein ACLRWQ_07015 [Flavonifractor plautii]